MASRKIVFLVPDISAQITTVAVHFAELLADDFDVAVIGPDLGRGISELHRDCTFLQPVSAPRIYRLPEFLAETVRLCRLADGDAVVAFKAYLDTVLPALWARRRGGRALVYLDELDSAVLAGLGHGERLGLWWRKFHHPLDEVYFPLAERLVRFADRVLCSSRSLARRFGGQVVHFGVDTGRFAPRRPEATAELRRRTGLDRFRTVVFGGAVRPHKGVEEILEAMRRLGRADLRLVVVGPETDLLRSLLASPHYGPLMVFLGPRPRAEMPDYLDLADLVVLPLQDTPLARTQVPCKVFEAMAMAKPIVATAVSDLPEILKGCGKVVPPGDPEALAGAIERILADPAEARRMGQAAREKCIREYSREQTRRKLLAVLSELGLCPGSSPVDG